ncbi:MAG: hypothetical protein WBL43_24415, partial [Pseudolabrys sp.]
EHRFVGTSDRLGFLIHRQVIAMTSQRHHAAGNPTMPLSVTPRRGDWTHQELCEIERIRAECAPLPGFELECAHTDEGDPWCIVYDHERELVVLHIARIDSRYVMARASHSKPLTGVIVRRHKRGFG